MRAVAPSLAGTDLTRIIRHGSVLCAAHELPPARRGPLRHPQRGRRVRGAVVAAVAGALGYARRMAHSLDEDPIRAVHELRKSLRRTRAIIELLRPVLPSAERRALLAEIRAVLRSTSTARDLQVMKETLAGVPASFDSQPARAALEAMLDGELQRRALDRRRRARLLAGVGRLDSLPVRLRSSLPDGLQAQVLCEAVADSYRRARRAGKRARKTRDPKAVHSWRKRVKELRYQLELMGTIAGSSVEALHRELAGAAQRLGKATDLAVLSGAVREWLPELPPQAARALLRDIEHRRARKVERVLKRLRHLFDVRPRRLHAMMST